MCEQKQQQQSKNDGHPYPSDWAFTSPAKDHPAKSNQQVPNGDHVAQQQQQQQQG